MVVAVLVWDIFIYKSGLKFASGLLSFDDSSIPCKAWQANDRQ